MDFGKLRDMYRLQREAKKVKKELQRVQVEAEGRYVKVITNAEQEVVRIEALRPSPSDADLCADIKDCVNRCMKKAQVYAAEKMKGVMGEMGLPG
ncbi:hypothetical protein A3H22_00035 [Candidatus Peribacteria bacterium RIFCSPLOWO2_12_FULL_55_15]|nr:MAG: hypothetical protein A2789_01410 [Candidatus Peribacteria bacterium RIFCSPHIGHO2_01_FULL_54_22]OGJ63085.1 MAG: hypothetical protein A3D12_02585 [Candidatus Peribacteria bacterium RIFCSPHIGHO2_02_FULL_55_24]OGJ63959.1 MAG: hypothetical protein A3E47_00535 [Candidatus Peribacteria bacterium RIFCSPHIGHO2_12_FULL_54_10]OGJ68127.1 MAG: hypothetical protein A2947_03080 [Candidatus Peribacteria bacterium RIFCSPLOWO2_01_FULL_54_110]OGJ70149.1 MAG: hypothetical protein A3H90_00385 [Candidatus Pe